MPRHRNRRRLTEAERDARRHADRERIEQAARALLTSDGWQRWIRVRATNGLSRYSLRNQWLIACECHARGITPTYIAGFRAFLALNRCVRKGQTAIKILAPVAVKQRDDAGEETGEKRIFFRTVPVFDKTLSRDLLRGVVGRCGSAVEDARQRATRRSHGGAGEEPGGRRARAAVRPLVRAPGTRIG
jgi:N-terminal domain of anti-restriction factor ArdC